MPNATDFNAIRISLASPEQIKQWSYGEVTKPETINYRTLRPEKEGLFCERIFGPTKDWECYCGKYKKIRYKGVICDRCGVEVARSKVRRERMGHVSLAAPVAHIWFAKGIPSRLGLLLDLSPRNLERVLYFAQYAVTDVDEIERQHKLDELEEAYESSRATLLTQLERDTERLVSEMAIVEIEGNAERLAELDAERVRMSTTVHAEVDLLKTTYENERDEIESIQSHIHVVDRDTGEKRILSPMLLTESRFRELNDRYGDMFRASMGAGAILDILRNFDLDQLMEQLEKEVHDTSGQRRKKAVKRIRVIEALRRSQNKPEWMIMTALPVLPPDLRPMVQLDGGRFATSDLNDLYRRVINRNNRLKRLLDLGAPEIIVRNEKRMLQEAVDDLIDNGRRGRAITGNHAHKLKSLSDLLRGKQGRFRQNLLGKRVDYGGRSVIVVGPNLRLHECGLPKKMALELFKPFVMNLIVKQGLAHNIKSAKRMVERARPEVWDILEEVIQGRPVLLNRAPTLHRLGIQAFMPTLVEGSAIQLHPLVCAAFNADFDGDQMAVHVPLSQEAVYEAKNVMLSTFNMLSPSSGEPLVAPTYEIVLGCYYLTKEKEGAKGEGRKYRDFDDVMVAFDAGMLDLRSIVCVRNDLAQSVEDEAPEETVRDRVNCPPGWMKTTPGRIIFNGVLPEEVRRYDQVMDKKALRDIVNEVYRLFGNDATAEVLDELKKVGFHYATISGTTIGITDIQVPPDKAKIVADADRKIEEIESQYEMGLLTDREKHQQAVSTWQEVSSEMDKVIQKHLPNFGGIYDMAHSGARGNEAQIKQMAAMRGLMSNPRGDIIELPIKSSFREGLSVLEYFISTHGARKGLADTALRTADSGYLTRRLIDVAQEVIVMEEDCGAENGVLIHAQASEEDVMIARVAERILGRVAAARIAHPETGEILVEAGEMVLETAAEAVEQAGVAEIWLRSPLMCEAERGICQRCYGRSPATGQLALIGDAVGIIAAQSIGEPGTQLTMRTFHMGGIAGKDITSGLPRVEELFEARVPKGKARIAEIEGEVLVFGGGDLVVDHVNRMGVPFSSGVVRGSTLDGVPYGLYEPGVLIPPTSMKPVIRVVNRVPFTDTMTLPDTHRLTADDGQAVNAGEVIAEVKADGDGAALPELANILARATGTLRVVDGGVAIDSHEEYVRDHQVDATDQRLVHTGDRVIAGQKLTSGVKDPHDILRIQGVEATQRYLVEQVQTVYRNQGVSINDKHIETIIRQLLRWVRVKNIGDTTLLPNQLIDRIAFQAENERVLAEGGEPATSDPEILGVTRASLNTESFLAKASFQETARVLTEAALLGETDYLRGLKENVIIGRLIPARLDVSEDGRKLLGLPQPPPGLFADTADYNYASLMAGLPGEDVDFDDSALLDLSLDDEEEEEEDDDILALADEEDDDLIDEEDDLGDPEAEPDPEGEPEPDPELE